MEFNEKGPATKWSACMKTGIRVCHIIYRGVGHCCISLCPKAYAQKRVWNGALENLLLGKHRNKQLVICIYCWGRLIINLKPWPYYCGVTPLLELPTISFCLNALPYELVDQNIQNYISSSKLCCWIAFWYCDSHLSSP